jgi:hypothetical protein
VGPDRAVTVRGAIDPVAIDRVAIVLAVIVATVRAVIAAVVETEATVADSIAAGRKGRRKSSWRS